MTSRSRHITSGHISIRRRIAALTDRIAEKEVELNREDYNDLARVHLFDWLEQVPRCQEWGYRREAYRGMATRLGGSALAYYDKVFSAEGKA